MKGVIPFLWFGTQAEEAARYYASIFPDAKMGIVVPVKKVGKSASPLFTPAPNPQARRR